METKEKLLRAARMIVEELDKEIEARKGDFTLEEWGEIVDMYKDASEICKNVHKVDYYEKK